MTSPSLPSDFQKMKNPNSSTLEIDNHEYKEKDGDDADEDGYEDDDELDHDGDDDEGDHDRDDDEVEGDDNLMKSRNVEKMALHPHSMNHLKIYGQTVQISSPSSWSYSPSS